VRDDALVLRVERLRDAAENLRDNIRVRYTRNDRPVTARTIRDEAAQIGERWLVEIGGREDIAAIIDQETLARLNVEFQRLITFAEVQTVRARYDTALRSILRDFRTRIVIPLKQARHRAPVPATRTPVLQRQTAQPTIFVGQSFSDEDRHVNEPISSLLKAHEFTVITGERPRAESVSKKVRDAIESSHYFLGIFTRRDRIRRRNEWTTSAWVIDEKAYAFAQRKKLILVKETGVQSIGGIQGDYEFIEFARNQVPELLIKLTMVLRTLSSAEPK
jgi:hypothetical protein